MTTNAVTRRGVRIDRNEPENDTFFCRKYFRRYDALAAREILLRKKVTHALALALDRGSLRCYSGSLALDFSRFTSPLLF